jgi:hypothetical protein
MLAISALKDDGATASNLHILAITELHRAHHVVVGARVQVPPLLRTTAHSSEVDLGARLVKEDGLSV